MKSKFRRIKAQAGAFTNAINLDEGPMADALMDWDINMRGVSPVNRVLSKDNTPVSNVYDSQGRLIGKNDSEGNIVRNPAQLDTSYKPTANDYLDSFNAAALGVTGIANIIQNNKLKKREEEQVIRSLEPKYWQNMEAEGLNNLPMYTQYGGGPGGFGPNLENPGIDHEAFYGDVSIYQYGGMKRKYSTGRKQAGGQDQVMQIIQMFAQMNGQDPQEIIQQLQQLPAEEQQAAIQQMAQAVQQQPQQPQQQEAVMQTGGSVNNQLSTDLRSDWNNYVGWLESKGVKGSPELDKNNTGFKYLDEYRKANPNTLLSKESIPQVQNYLQEYRNWVIESHKNKTRPIQFKEDPGSNYELFMPNLSKVDGYPGQFTTSYKFPQEFLNARPIGYASIAKQQAGGYGTYYSKNKRKQAGGEVHEVYGLPDNLAHFADVNAEAGEIVKTQKGRYVKVADDANTHEQGGEMIPNVDRVLEDTSRKRKDKASKMLKVEPEVVEGVFGFRPKTATSHAKVFQLVKEELNKTNKIYQRANKDANVLPKLDKTTINSLKLNDMFQGQLPSEDEVFEMLFNHQEGIKMQSGIQDDGSMKKYGGKYKAQTGTLAGKQNVAKNLKTPKGNVNQVTYPGGLPALVDKWKDVIPGIENVTDPAEFQQMTYDYLLKNQPELIDQTIWSEGLNRAGIDMFKGGKDAAFNEAVTRAFDPKSFAVKPGYKFTQADREALGKAYPDKYLMNRLVVPEINATTTTDQGVPGEVTTKTPSVLNPVATVNPRFIKQPVNNFHEPTYWSDIIGPATGLIDSFRRDPELYNPQEFHQLRYKLLDPTAAVTANQADFNAATSGVNEMQGMGMSAASKAGLLGQKYRANNQVLSQYENQNVGIKNNEITYNTQVRDKQSAADAQSRATFYRNVQLGREAQRQQQMTSLGQLARVDQLKRRQNRSGNLVMKLSPAFDQYGEYNGYQYAPYLDPFMVNTTDEQQVTPSPKKSKTTKTITFKNPDGSVSKTVVAQ